MSDIQIYYLIPSQLNKGLERMRIDLSLILLQGDKTITQVYNEVKANPDFCRDELGINYNHFVSLIYSDISIYASLNGIVAGLLGFMFVERQGKKYILLNGLCSPVKYGGRGIGQELVNTLIRIGKYFNINYINLECKGDALMNYYKKFRFVVTNKKTSYDSDDSDDEDDGHLYYNMRLDLKTISGGKKKRKTFKRKSRREKRKNTRRKLRK
jgi:hypothetical protein